MPPAARVGDVTNHGGTITGPGVSTVLVGGQPAAVAGDMHVCVLPPSGHQPGTVVVDLAGYNRWKWNPDGSMGRALGASVIMALSDHATMTDITWGFMVHVNNRFSIGMGFDRSNQSVLMSADVAKLWTKTSDARKQALKLVPVK